MNADLIIFDCDGVLVDSEPISFDVLLRILTEHGVHIEPDIAYERFLGKSVKTMGDVLKSEYGLAIDDAFLDGMRASLYERFQTELQPIPGIAETLDGLNIKRCVASSSQPERIRLSLTLTGLIDKLDPHIFSATMVANGKPAPDLFLLAADTMNVDPRDCVVIEDSPAGILAAKAANMRVFAFAGGTHANNERHKAILSALKPDHLFDDMRDLLHLVG
ncbi:HAD family hydrolase [Rhizobium sp. CFBP 8762]|uniref:HAD family hydrolase n=1 Tax=Rhizobium sp. CFBP 8762 TaxID=2775279 RepID=UPI001783FE5B|nr:HAD family hydrolase [Rhizobium sp. CFBP 8762]MBD8556582.1 HAD family hydrolase [Rhizobium sp. CFBP 8762]